MSHGSHYLYLRRSSTGSHVELLPGVYFRALTEFRGMLLLMDGIVKHSEALLISQGNL
jgi:hypothetical protein